MVGILLSTENTPWGAVHNTELALVAVTSAAVRVKVLPSQIVLVAGIVITGWATIVIFLTDTASVLHSEYPLAVKVKVISPIPLGLIVGEIEFGLRIVAGPDTVQTISS